MLDLLIKNVHIIDTINNLDRIGNIAIKDGKIAPEEPVAKRIIDGTGLMATPGWIDFHTHFFQGSAFYMSPDIAIHTGVTATNDAGSSGWLNFYAMYQQTLLNSTVHAKAFLAYNDHGTANGPESYALDTVHWDRIKQCFEKYPDTLLGLKIRLISTEVKDIQPLKDCIRLAEELKVPVNIHLQSSLVPMADVASILRPGDFFCHMYHGTNETIIDENGKVYDAVLDARDRGVVMDATNGWMGFNFNVAEHALAQGLFPDIIASDMSLGKLHMNPCCRSLPYIMSKFIAMGVPFHHVIKAVTETPAKYMKLKGYNGLIPGSLGDVTLFQWKDIPATHTDFQGDARIIPRHLIPMGTIIGGNVYYLNEEMSYTAVT